MPRAAPDRSSVTRSRIESGSPRWSRNVMCFPRDVDRDPEAMTLGGIEQPRRRHGVQADGVDARRRHPREVVVRPRGVVPVVAGRRGERPVGDAPHPQLLVDVEEEPLTRGRSPRRDAGPASVSIRRFGSFRASSRRPTRPPRSHPSSGAMRILITGGAGYIGSHTTRELLRPGSSRGRPRPRPDPQHAGLDGATSIVADIRDTGQVAAILRSEAHRGRHPFRRTQVRGRGDARPGPLLRRERRRLAVGAPGHGRGRGAGDRLLVELHGLWDACSNPATEDMPPQPENPYGASKLFVEQMLGWFGRIHGIRSMSLRYFNAAGASFDGRLGERGSDADAHPDADAGGAWTARTGGHLWHGLPDARRHRDP